jgi:hypothetical protein
VHNLEEARAYIRAGALRSFADNGIGPYAIVVDDSGSREDGGVGVGVAGLFQRPYLDAPDLGYALVTEAQGKGYALEAARAVVAHAKEVLGLSRLLAIVVRQCARWLSFSLLGHGATPRLGWFLWSLWVCACVCPSEALRVCVRCSGAVSACVHVCVAVPQDPEHVRSAGLLTKLGFTMSGTVVPPGETEPINTWELVL